MILRKPYAFFIRMFKPIHILLALLITYLIYLQNNILIFFNSYIHSSTDVATVSISILIYIIPLIIVLLCAGIFAIMSRKNKPVKFYVVTFILFIGIIIINVFVNSYVKQLSENIISVSKMKIARDLSLINIIVEGVLFVLLLIRGLGINIKKFDFSSDLLKLDINDEDREEIEISVNVDSDMRKRNRRSDLRNFKYIYLESKLFYNAIFIGVFIGLVLLGIATYNSVADVEKSTYVYSSNGFSFKVNQTYIVDKNYKGNDIDNLIVVDTGMLSYNSKSIELDSFSLIIESVEFKPITKYASSLIDIGVSYIDNELTNSYSNYLLVFDVPEKYMKSKMILKYVGSYDSVRIRLKPIKLNSDSKIVAYSLGEEADMKDSLGDIKFKVTEFDIKNNYLINYDYCRNDVCIPSVEYIKPSINQKYDKAVMRLKVEFNNNSDVKISSFYDLLNRFGMIKYGNNIQTNGYEELTSNKKNTGYIYIGVNKDILGSDSIKLLFNIRNVNLEYNLRG